MALTVEQQLQAAANRADAAAEAFNGVLVGDDTTDVPVEGAQTVPSAAKRLKDLFDAAVFEGTLTGPKGDKGDPGDPGADGADGENGAAAVWRGAYNPATTYLALDAVEFNGSGYIATASVQGEDPDVSASWDLFAAKGDDGAQGLPGADGADAAYSNATPQPPGVAAAGIADEASRSDHVHPLPTTTQLGLDKVDNTSDVDKPLSTLQQAALDAKAPLASPALTGTPTAPTAAPGSNSTQISTTEFVQAALAALVDSSPAALDTLNELAAALGDDPNFAATITAALALKVATTGADFTALGISPEYHDNGASGAANRANGETCKITLTSAGTPITTAGLNATKSFLFLELYDADSFAPDISALTPWVGAAPSTFGKMSQIMAIYYADGVVRYTDLGNSLT